MSFIQKVTVHYGVVSAETFTNKESVFEVLDAVRDLEELVKELKFQANNAKRDPDASAQEMLDAVDANLNRLENRTLKLRKKLGLV